ncbi:MAG TPA: MBL fold metallo-hydrolase [Tepidiformaceae bacterium]|nr:MBL fold metallo-hydrolase [Tepidiformaceae bacterium]
MKIQQFVAESLGDASYLLVSGSEAAVIDPQRDIEPFVKMATAHGATIRYVVETHVHNDYVSGGRELAALGAEVLAPAASGLEFPHRPMPDGAVLSVGDARIVAVRAPGHTYEHTAYLAQDPGGVTHGAFTGGALLMGAVGRTDLLGPGHTEQLTRLQWETARHLRQLVPVAADVLPTHGAGSFCSTTGTDLGRCGPMAAELQRNPALSSATFELFRDIQLGSVAPIPGYYRHMAPLNRKGPRVFGAVPRPPALDLRQFDALGPDVYRVDVRARQDYAARHLPATLEIEESNSFLAYAGWLIPFNAPIALVSYDAAQAQRVTTDLFRIGYEDVRGFIAASTIEPPASLHTVGVREAADMIRAGSLPVLDVRYTQEHRDLPIPGARQLPFDEIQVWAQEIEAGPVLVVCASGQRSTMAASYLRRHGIQAIPLIEGGAAELLPLL